MSIRSNEGRRKATSRSLMNKLLLGLAVVWILGSLPPATGIGSATVTRGWTSVGDGTERIIQAMAVYKGELYAAGRFESDDGEERPTVARWTGQQWRPIPEAFNGDVFALAVGPDGLYIGGDFTIVGDAEARHVATWNGKNAAALGKGLDGSVRAIAFVGEDVYAGGELPGESGLARWNGQHWQTVSGGVSCEANSEADSAEPIAAGCRSAVYALAASGSDLYVGGSFLTAGRDRLIARSIAKYEARTDSWTSLGGGLSGGDDGGHPRNADDATDAENAEHTEFTDNKLAPSVKSLAVSGDFLYAGGRFEKAGDVQASGIARWNEKSKTWSSLGRGLSGGEALTIVADEREVVVGGSFDRADRRTTNGAAIWNAVDSFWDTAGQGVEGTIYALAPYDNDLYAGGRFAKAGAARASSFAKWGETDFGSRLSVPFPPVSVRAIAGDGQATVCFAMPRYDGGLPLTGYTVTAIPGGRSASGSGERLTVDGLQNGVPYTFVVKARNLLGLSESSAPSSPATPNIGIGAEPEAVCPPTDVGSASACSSNDIDSASACTPCDAGSSDICPPCDEGSSAVCPSCDAGSADICPTADIGSIPPAAPRNVSAHAGDGFAEIVFDPPVTVAGSRVAEYTVTAFPGGLTASSTSSPILLPGLENGTEYVFVVTASNAAGTSAPSDRSAPVVPEPLDLPGESFMAD